MFGHQELPQGGDRLRLEPDLPQRTVQQSLPQDLRIGAGVHDAAGIGGHRRLNLQPQALGQDGQVEGFLASHARQVALVQREAEQVGPLPRELRNDVGARVGRLTGEVDDSLGRARRRVQVHFRRQQQLLAQLLVRQARAALACIALAHAGDGFFLGQLRL